MPSYPRVHQLTNSLIYHVFNRSNGRVTIFDTEEDYKHFIKLLSEYGRAFQVKIYHWVIMSNHFHLLFEIEEPGRISKLMAGLARAYTHYYHKTYKTSGFLWQGRFKMQPIQKENYLIACGRYIERNPVRANIVRQAQDYAYSSASFYCCGKANDITAEDPTFIGLSDNSYERQSAYKEFLENFDTEEERSFANFESPQGNKEFVRRLIKEHGRYLPRRKGRLTERIIL